MCDPVTAAALVAGVGDAAATGGTAAAAAAPEAMAGLSAADLPASLSMLPEASASGAGMSAALPEGMGDLVGSDWSSGLLGAQTPGLNGPPSLMSQMQPYLSRLGSGLNAYGKVQGAMGGLGGQGRPSGGAVARPMTQGFAPTSSAQLIAQRMGQPGQQVGITPPSALAALLMRLRQGY